MTKVQIIGLNTPAPVDNIETFRNIIFSICPNGFTLAGRFEMGQKYTYDTALNDVAADTNAFEMGQKYTYDTALAEIKRGKKETHWIWYIFPIMAGLGKSEKSQYYALRDRIDAIFYLLDPTLGTRLIECTEAILESGKSAYEIFGNDTWKVYCCMRLFNSLCYGMNPFKKVLLKNHWNE